MAMRGGRGRGGARELSESHEIRQFRPLVHLVSAFGWLALSGSARAIYKVINNKKTISYSFRVQVVLLSGLIKPAVMDQP